MSKEKLLQSISLVDYAKEKNLKESDMRRLESHLYRLNQSFKIKQSKSIYPRYMMDAFFAHERKEIPCYIFYDMTKLREMNDDLLIIPELYYHDDGMINKSQMYLSKNITTKHTSLIDEQRKITMVVNPKLKMFLNMRGRSPQDILCDPDVPIPRGETKFKQVRTTDSVFFNVTIYNEVEKKPNEHNYINMIKFC